MRGIASHSDVGSPAYFSPLCKITEIHPEGIFCTSVLDGGFGHEGGITGDDNAIFGGE